MSKRFIPCLGLMIVLSSLAIAQAPSIPGIFNRIAVGDFDGDRTDESVMSFPGLGVWIYDAGAWGQISTHQAEELVAGEGDIVADFGTLGLWIWQNGVWTQISANNPEYIVSAPYPIQGKLFCDFGEQGLWLWADGAWSQLTAANPDYFCFASSDILPHQGLVIFLFADFGAEGMWWREVYYAPSLNNWYQFSDLSPEFFVSLDFSNHRVIADFGGLGLWAWTGPQLPKTWTQLSAVDPEYMVEYGWHHLVVDFGSLGLWFWDGTAWTQLSGADPQYMIGPLVDFGSLGLWEYDDSAWVQLSGADPDNLVLGDFDGDGDYEWMADFGTLGVWIWDQGIWTQISANNPA